jgi:hypothetical protein
VAMKVGSRARTVALLVAVVGAAGFIAASQPLSGPWWLYADSDAVYAGSSLKLVSRQQTTYFDHPGWPLQEALALTFEARRLVHNVNHRALGPRGYANRQLGDLQDARLYWRALAIVLYLLGAGVTALLIASLLRSRAWGLVGGLLWIGAPALAPMSIQYRADVLLSTLVLMVGFLTFRAAERRSGKLYAVAAFALGFAMTVKANSSALIPVLLLAMLLWPGDTASLRGTVAEAGRAVRRRKVAIALGIAVVVWCAVAADFIAGPFPPPTTSEEQRLVFGYVLSVVAYSLVTLVVQRRTKSRLPGRLFNPVIAVAIVSLGLGAAIPASLFPTDALPMILKVQDTVLGGGVNRGVALFQFPHSEFESWPLRQGVLLLGLSGIAAVVGVARREGYWSLWLLGALAIGATAAARGGATYYYAPAYILTVPAALWVLRERAGRFAGFAAIVVLAYVLVPQIQHRRGPVNDARLEERQAAVFSSIGAKLLRPGEVALVDQEAPTPDSRYNGLVENFLEGVPQFPNRRFIEDFRFTPEWGRRFGLTFGYYIGRRALQLPDRVQPMRFISGTYVVRPLPAYSRPDLNLGVVKLLRGPRAPSRYRTRGR